MKENNELTAEVKEFCQRQGAAITKVADAILLKKGVQTYPPNLLSPYTAVISIAIPLNMKIIAAMSGLPTPEYASNCKEINEQLNNITVAVKSWIEGKGYSAKAIPASKKIIEGGTEASISHKAIAITAGIGWQGKSLLVVTPDYGPRIRLSSVLTDMPLIFDSPIKNLCKKCTACTDACPAGAIKNVNTEFHYLTREEAIDLDKCHANTLKNMEIPGVEYTFCGQCIPVCPHGKKFMKKMVQITPNY